MCPACLAAAALIIAGATTSGGVTAVLAKKLIRSKRAAKTATRNSMNHRKDKAP